jgi:hypothetical protein
MRGPLKWSTLLFLPVATVACLVPPPPLELRESALVAPDAAYGCALGLVDSLGYTLRASDRASGFLSAGRAYTVFAGQRRDQLTVAILKVNDSTQVHVTAKTTDVTAKQDGADNATTIGASDKLASDAILILSRCGDARVASAGQP